MTAAIMLQGTGSNVGKSMLVAGLCRYFQRQGLRVRPFKPQNMSNNAAVAIGGEIGRAQALQALACGVDAHVDMNPVLLKPETDSGSQIIVQGQRMASVRAKDYAALRPKLLPYVLESYGRLAKTADLVIVEGAGSPAEVNLRAADIANMGFAQAAKLPVILVGDIDRGGVIAQIVGTKAVLSAEDNAHIHGFMVNKFRGDISLFAKGEKIIETHTQWPSLGVIPWFPHAHALPAEDSADLKYEASKDAALNIIVPQFSRMANFDDLDPLRLTPNVSVRLIPAGQPLPADADLILLPGSKSTRGDLAFLREQGWDIDIYAHHRRGGHILGICGGYQMLGTVIRDPDGLEGTAGETAGLGLLDIETTMLGEKQVKAVKGTDLATGHAVHGYEIHLGKTSGADCDRPWLNIEGTPTGAASLDGRVQGAYVHGLFAADAFRSAYLNRLFAEPCLNAFDKTSGTDKAFQFTGYAYQAQVEATLDQLADHLANCLDLEALYQIALTEVVLENRTIV